MRMNFRFIFVQGDVADERKNLDLFGKGNSLVLFRGHIEVTEDRIAKGSNRCEVTRAQMMHAREEFQRFDNFISGLKNECPGFLLSFGKKFRFHFSPCKQLRPSWPPN